MRGFSVKVLKAIALSGLEVMLLGLPAVSFAAQEGEGVLEKLNIEVSGSLDFYSQYLWRGFTLDTDSVIQPGFNLSWGGVTLSFWSSWDAVDSDDLKSNEADYVLDYTKEFDDFALSLGHTFYNFPSTNSYSKEFYIGVSFPNLALSPEITYYRDYGKEEKGGGDGDYLALGLSYSHPVKNSQTTFDLGLSLGYNRKLFIEGYGRDYLVSVGFTIPLRENLTFSPTLNYAVPLGSLKDSDDGEQKERFYSGFSLSYNF